MTTARFFTTGSRIDAVEITGHAGYAQEGEDIVCAAVSANLDLTSCLLADVLGLALTTEVDEQHASIRIALPDQLEEAEEIQAQNALSALMLYLINLKARYQDFIEVMEV
ncbi:MAG: ribosomal-processing cysteine protease Prp [Eubacteriales bacterium]|nr:ribosomal-processing cysteine protease Prp [Eubacteriales bacterium]